MNLDPIEQQYGITTAELLEAMNRRFRAKVTLEGVVAEIHLGKKIKALKERGVIAGFVAHDEDGKPDYSIVLPSDSGRVYLVECKNVRDKDEAYRKRGEITAYKVETQKTRASKGDPSSRFYGFDQFDILAVCIGQKTGDWSQFMFIRSNDLPPHG
jgi:hypothetical protein